MRWFIVYELPPSARLDCMARLSTWLGEGRLQHAIADTFTLDAVVDAHERVESFAAMGNVVITIGS